MPGASRWLDPCPMAPPSSTRATMAPACPFENFIGALPFFPLRSFCRRVVTRASARSGMLREGEGNGCSGSAVGRFRVRVMFRRPDTLSTGRRRAWICRGWTRVRKRNRPSSRRHRAGPAVRVRIENCLEQSARSRAGRPRFGVSRRGTEVVVTGAPRKRLVRKGHVGSNPTLSANLRSCCS